LGVKLAQIPPALRDEHDLPGVSLPAVKRKEHAVHQLASQAIVVGQQHEVVDAAPDT
jgi:hypothetical protein